MRCWDLKKVLDGVELLIPGGAVVPRSGMFLFFYTGRCQICCLSRASGVIVVVSGHSWCQWCSDWCALGCSATVAFGCVCSSYVFGWLTSVEVFAAVPLWSVLLSVVLGRGILCRPLARCRQVVSSRHSDTGGPPRHARASRVLGVGSQWHGC